MAEARALTYPSSRWQSARGFVAAHIVGSTGGLLALLLAIFLIWPLIAVLARSAFTPDGFTLEYYREFLSKSYYYRSFFNSLLLGVLTTTICLGTAYCIAYMTTRGPTYLRRPLRLITFLPLISPSYMFALSLIILFGRQGMITKTLGLDWTIYGFTGVVIAQSLAFLPLAYIMIENSLSSLDPNLEDSAANLGASEGQILRSITIPLLRPAFLKAALIVFVLAMSDFGNAALLSGRTHFLAPDIYNAIVGEANYTMGSVLSAFLLFPIAVVFTIQNYLIRGKGYTTITGRPVATEPRHISPAILTPMLFLSLIAGGFILLTFVVIGLGSFTKIVGIDNTFTLKSILDMNSTGVLINSIKVSLLAGLLGGIVSILLAYVIVRGKFRGRATTEAVAVSGITLPGTVLGIGYILAFNRPPLLLTGTIVILSIISAFRHLVVGMEAGITKLKQLSIEVEEASLNLGASIITTFRRIVFPIIFPAFMYGFMYNFMRAMVALSAMIFLISPGYSLASVYIFNQATLGSIGLASATTLKLIVITAITLAIMQYLSKWTGLSVTRRKA